MPHGHTSSLVRAAALAHFDDLVRSLGGDPDALLCASGLSMRDLANLDRYLPYRYVVRAIEEAAQQLGTPDFGLRLCALQNIETLGLLSLAIQSAPTVREGLLQGEKYMHLHNPALSFCNFMAPADGLECLAVIHKQKPLAAMPQITEICVSYLCRLIDLLSEGALKPAAIYLQHAPLGSNAQYRRHLRQLPVFHASFDGIAIDPLAWRRPLRRHSRLMQQFVERFLLGVQFQRELSMTSRVSGVLDGLVRVSMTDLPTVSRVLGQHPRTLQRRLILEDVKFEDLRDNARKTWARELLDQSDLRLVDISSLLGFSNQSVFTRACLRWFGTPPRSLRQAPKP